VPPFNGNQKHVASGQKRCVDHTTCFSLPFFRKNGASESDMDEREHEGEQAIIEFTVSVTAPTRAAYPALSVSVVVAVSDELPEDVDSVYVLYQ
jgi:hypothetical protein